MNLETLEDGITYCVEEVWSTDGRLLYDTDDEYGFVHAHMCEERAEDYSQLATWLTELRRYKEMIE